MKEWRLAGLALLKPKTWFRLGVVAILAAATFTKGIFGGLDFRRSAAR